jgi:elongation factor G
MVNRLGKVDDGTSTTDYDEEEIQRKFSITAGLAYAEWGKTKINFIDTPGYNIFIHETEGALLAADAALLLIHAVAGIEVQTEKSWGFCEKYGLPRPGDQSDGPRPGQLRADPRSRAQGIRAQRGSCPASHR